MRKLLRGKTLLEARGSNIEVSSLGETALERVRSSTLSVAFWGADLDGRAFNLRPTPFCSTKAVRRSFTPSPLPPGITLDSTSDRPPQSGGNAIAHIAGQEFAIRVCRARCPREPTASFPLLGVGLLWPNCLISCQVSRQIGCRIADEADGWLSMWRLSIIEHVRKICRLNLKSRTSVRDACCNACKVGSECNRRAHVWVWHLRGIELVVRDGNFLWIKGPTIFGDKQSC